MTTNNERTPVFSFREGSTPLLISVPHDGRLLPENLSRKMTAAGRDIADTDWHVARLYEFAVQLGASLLVAQYSRYVVDLNRSASDEPLYDGQLSTGLCPEQTFSGQPIYRQANGMNSTVRAQRIERYWSPYHSKLSATLAALRERHRYALLWDAHSIASQVPELFDGELPELNIGTYDGKSCAYAIAAGAIDVAQQSPYETVVNARFKGGYITRHYGQPGEHIHALQLEIAQRTYMNEHTRQYDAEKSTQLCATLTAMLAAYADAARHHYK